MPVPGTSDKTESLVRVLRELTLVQRNLANLQVELQGRQDDQSVAHLTHVSEMEKKCQALSRTTAILKEVIQNKDRIIARLQQPYSLDCIPVETEYQKQFSELLLKAAGDYGALTAAVSDFQWTQGFKHSPTIWGELLRPIPVALASCTRYFEGLTAMREAVAEMQKARVRSTYSSTLARDPSWVSDRVDQDCATPPWNSGNFTLEEPSSDDVLLRSRKRPEQMEMSVENSDWGVSISDFAQSESTDDSRQRRLSWPGYTSDTFVNSKP
ncbi:hypothetical protein KP509_31G030300 [Ceratopteris richardii]|nr:hypothetical protein KP509_31G030300 [Ceratopteris richardii]